MSVPLVDLAVKNLIDFAIGEVLKNPVARVKEIFGDANLEPHAAIYGTRLQEQIRQWITTTRIPVVVSHDLEAAQIPGVTVHLAGSRPELPIMGDAGLMGSYPIAEHERTVVLESFIPSSITMSEDGTFFTIGLPDDFSEDQKQLVAPGLSARDKNRREYAIGFNEDANLPTIAQKDGGDPLNLADLSEIAVISPYSDVLYREGSMVYSEEVLVAVHGHAQRPEGLWLWAIVHHSLLKYRPILTSTFGLDLAMPQASDFIKDDAFMGDNVWRRFITLTAKSVWSWQGPNKQDVLAFLLSLKAAPNSDASPPPEATEL